MAIRACILCLGGDIVEASNSESSPDSGTRLGHLSIHRGGSQSDANRFLLLSALRPIAQRDWDALIGILRYRQSHVFELQQFTMQEHLLSEIDIPIPCQKLTQLSKMFALEGGE
ncbi:hypothetical protein K474DRAFT_666006 [Panus rudis PR-1116 ss-1]|nr:hypothetical protein K474DRAFT_666006 [Panus rudis PR-1116 ss-1]